MTRDMNSRHRDRLHLALCCAVALAGMFATGCSSSKAYPTRDGGSQDIKRETGPVNITGTLNQCPVLVIVASPNRTTVGAQSSLVGNATDPDHDVLTFRWESNGGTFANPTLAETIFNCTQAGSVAIKLTVDDGSCKTVEMATVLCMPGDGGVTEGGAGDGGRSDAAVDGTAGGDARDAAAGTGGRPGTGGSPGGSGGLTGSLGTGGKVGTGGNSAGTGGGVGSGGSTGSGGQIGSGGGGASGGSVGSGGSPGNGGAVGTGGSGSGSTCVEIGSAACNACTDAMCDPTTDGCCGFTDPADVALCNAAATCFRDKACTVGGDPLNCFCGDSGATCSMDPHGVCLAEVQAAAKSMDPTVIVSRFVYQMYPIGRAANLYTCRSTVCPTECPAP